LGLIANLGRLDGAEVGPADELPSWNIDLDGDGDGIVAWQVWSDDLVDTFLRARVVRRDGTLGQPRNMGTGSSPVVAVAPSGNVRLTLWSGVQDVTQLLLWTRA